MSFSTLLGNATGYAAAFQANDVTTDEMRTAINGWFQLYYQQFPADGEDPCQQIPYTIVRKLTKTVFAEYEANSEDPFAADLLKTLWGIAPAAMQMALIGGESLLKPIITNSGIRFAVVLRHSVLVFGRDAEGNMTDIGTAEYSINGEWYYTLLERRTVDENGYLTIRNKLYRSKVKGTLGQAAPLSSIPRYAELQEEYTFTQPVRSIGLISLRTPMVNCVDGSADAVSVYAAAVGLIRSINRNEYQLRGEFDRAESRILVSADMLKAGPDGKRTFDEHLFVGLDEDLETTGVTIFNPTIRETSYLARKQEYLRNVENVIGLKRGLLSEVEAAERTATEITSSAGEYNLTIIDFQKAWEKTVQETMRLCSILGQLYRVNGAKDIPKDAVVITWGNGVLYDEAKTNEELKAQVQAGLLQPERYVGWYHNLPCNTPEERAEIRKNYMPETLLEGDV